MLLGLSAWDHRNESHQTPAERARPPDPYPGEYAAWVAMKQRWILEAHADASAEAELPAPLTAPHRDVEVPTAC